jgi:hypothetical protein
LKRRPLSGIAPFDGELEKLFMPESGRIHPLHNNFFLEEIQGI